MSAIQLLLDHGYLDLIETWGADEQIIKAARQSTGGGFKEWGPLKCPRCGGSAMDLVEESTRCAKCQGTGWIPGDEGLLRFLYTHQHHTPFEMAGATFEIQAPIFVFREWHRHRTQSYNEMSGRYIELPNFSYVPSDERINNARQATKNKQGSQSFEASEAQMVRHVVRTAFQDVYALAWKEYQEMLARGVAREIASRVLPVSQYSRMQASANLRNWLHFLELRNEESAQWEIRQYAAAVQGVLTEKFPRTMELFAGVKWRMFDEGMG